MEKLRMHSPDLTRRNIDMIAELFPAVITEALDADGNPVRAVDFDLLRQELSDHVAEGPQERYQLDWPGKRRAAFAANVPVAKTLRPVRGESVDFDTTKNLFIEGDNLDALKLLQESYLGKVKLIYIDPPYNTGNDFIYHDDFAESSSEYLARSGQMSEAGDKLVSNFESNGRYRSNWLSMIYPRLKLARRLLRDDGLICVSIDDHELASVTALLGEVFGRDNFIAILPRVTKRAGKSGDLIAANHDYVVLWGRSDVVSLRRELHSDSGFKNEDEYVETRGKYKLNQTLDYGSIQYSRSLDYEIEIEGIIVRPGGASVEEMHERQTRNPRTGWCWRWSRGLFDFGLRNGFVVIKEGRDGPRIYTKTYENATIAKRGAGYEVVAERRTRAITTLDLVDNRYSNDVAAKGIKSLFGFAAFDYTKPVELIRTLITWATDPGSGDIVLDFFAGSATTGQAVLEANAADGGDRKYLLIQLDEQTNPSSEAAARGFAKISELARERLRLAAAQFGSDFVAPNLDRGFRAFCVTPSNFVHVDRSPDQLEQTQLATFVETVIDIADSEAVLFEVLLQLGLDPALTIERVEFAHAEIHIVDGGALVACFAERLPDGIFEQIAVLEPLRVVVFDSAFSGPAERINAQQTLLYRSKLTELKTI